MQSQDQYIMSRVATTIAVLVGVMFALITLANYIG